MVETEIKLAVPNVPGLRKWLARQGARLGKRWHEFNTLFDTPQNTLRRSDRLLRLRTWGGKTVVTVKGKSLPTAAARAKYKRRREIEITVADARAARDFLLALGYRPGFRYEKFRTEVEVRGASGVHIYLDETPIGGYLEIEGQPRAIDRAARLLGYRFTDYITESYLALYAKFCRRRKRRMGDFLFRPEKKSREPAVSR